MIMMYVAILHILVTALLSPPHAHAVHGHGNISDQTEDISIPLGDVYPGRRNSDFIETSHSISHDTSATATSSEQIYIIVDQMPSPVGGTKAVYERMSYPDSARQAGIEGRVVVEFIVNPQGEVLDPVILHGLGGGLDEIVVEGIKGVLFEPGLLNGEAVSVRMQFPVLFRLEPDPDTIVQNNVLPDVLDFVDLQNITLDRMPEPIGGMASIYQNVRYPESARIGGFEGRVVVKITIDERGNVVKQEVVNSVGGGLDEAAMYALSRTRFTPAVLNGEPIAISFFMPIVFRLQHTPTFRLRQNRRN
jgi:TonB family protein